MTNAIQNFGFYSQAVTAAVLGPGGGGGGPSLRIRKPSEVTSSFIKVPIHLEDPHSAEGSFGKKDIYTPDDIWDFINDGFYDPDLQVRYYSLQQIQENWHSEAISKAHIESLIEVIDEANWAEIKAPPIQAPSLTLSKIEEGEGDTHELVIEGALEDYDHSILNETNMNSAVLAVLALGSFGEQSKQAIPTLIKAYQRCQDPEIRGIVLNALGAIGEANPNVIDTFIESLNIENERMFATLGIYSLFVQNESKPILKRLVKPLQKALEEDPGCGAERPLAILGEDMVHVFIKMLLDEKSPVELRRACAKGLKTIQEEKKIPLERTSDLISALKDPDPEVRDTMNQVLMILGRICNRSKDPVHDKISQTLFDRLAHLIEDQKLPDPIRERAAGTLVDLFYYDFDSPALEKEIAQFWGKALQSDCEAVRIKASFILRIKIDWALQELPNLLAEIGVGQTMVQVNVLHALIEIARKEDLSPQKREMLEEAVPHFLEVLAHEDSKVQKLIIELLGDLKAAKGLGKLIEYMGVTPEHGFAFTGADVARAISRMGEQGLTVLMQTFVRGNYRTQYYAMVGLFATESSSDEVIDIFIQALGIPHDMQKKDPAILQGSIEYLKNNGPKASEERREKIIEALIYVMTHYTDPVGENGESVEYWDSTSQKAAWALTAFGQKAVNSLIEVVNSPNDEWSLCMATDALGGFFGKDGFLMGSTMDNPRIAKILSDALDRPDCSSLCQKHVLDALNILGASSVAALAGIRRILRSSDVDKEVLNSALSVLITLGPLAHEMRNDVKDILTARGWEEDPGYFSWGSTYLKAALTLAAIGETAVPLLIQTLDWKCTDNAESRWAAIRGIQELPKPLGEAAIPALWNSLADPNAQVQEGAMRALNVLLPNKREEINQEAEQLKEDFEGMVRKILKMPPHRREVAIGNLNRKPDKTRIEFYQAISALDTQANDLVWVLEDNALNDPNPKVREAAANALKDMEGVHAYRAFRRVKQAYKEAKEAEFLYDDHDSATPGNFSVRVRGTLEAMTRLQGMFSDLNQLENMESSEIDLSGVDKIHMEFELEGTKMSMELTPKDGGLELGNSEEDRENGEREPPVFKPEVHDFRPWPNG